MWLIARCFINYRRLETWSFAILCTHVVSTVVFKLQITRNLKTLGTNCKAFWKMKPRWKILNFYTRIQSHWTISHWNVRLMVHGVNKFDSASLETQGLFPGEAKGFASSTKHCYLQLAGVAWQWLPWVLFRKVLFVFKTHSICFLESHLTFSRGFLHIFQLCWNVQITSVLNNTKGASVSTPSTRPHFLRNPITRENFGWPAHASREFNRIQQWPLGKPGKHNA